MAGYSGMSMSNNAVEAYNKRKKPVSKITKEDIQKHGVNEGITFFQWFVKNRCKSHEWHHTSARYNETGFFDIEECCTLFKKSDIEHLKNKYKLSKPKPVKKTSENPFYAKVKYSISINMGRERKPIETYAVIHGCWAYVKDDYKNEIIKAN
jgi:hypothetical protein